jgi:glycosyltransferase involved in cell wall biosynthesis
MMVLERNAPGPGSPERPIRVAFLIDTLRPAGAEKQLVTVATGLDRRRFLALVICLTAEGPYAHELRQAGIPVVLIGKRHKAGILAYCRLRALLRRERPDILHTWMFTCNLYGRLAARGLPVATLASEVAADLGKSSLRLAIDRMLATRTRAFYVNSSVVARFYHERCAIPLDKIVVIPNGVRVPRAERTPRAALGVREDAFLVCGAGRLSPEKGFDRVVEALATPLLKARNVALVIAGDGPSRGALEALIGARDLADRVHLLGHRDDLPAVLNAADAFVVSSVHEGMSNVLMEAMALGLPCVSTPVGGVAELMGDDEAGLVVTASAPEPIAVALARLMDSPALARRLGLAARDRMARSFSIEANIRRFEALYAALATPGSQASELGLRRRA